MPKHKKFLRSEKAKIKLKAAKLPKGLNVTKTEFKVKKIVIKEQIRDWIDQDGLVKPHNIKDLLSKLKHHNSNYRNEGLRHLSLILTNYVADSTKHMNAIVHGIAQLCMDVERDVRRESFKALETLLTLVTAQTISPFWEILSSYLRCAMTHITTGIQEDSLLMLDCLLAHVPSLVAGDNERIFASFLDMVSKKRSNVQNNERTLSMNLTSQLTSLKWRNKVLERLNRMLCLIDNQKESVKLVDEKVNNPEVVEDAFQFIEPSIKLIKSKTYNFEPGKSNYFPINRNESNERQVTDNQSERNRLKSYTDRLMPLIFEMWLEVCPHLSDDFHKTPGRSTISSETAYTLHLIIQVIKQILQLLKSHNCRTIDNNLIDWFSQRYSADFNQYFTMSFPYSRRDGDGKSNKKKVKGIELQVIYGPKCLEQNIGIALIFCQINKILKGKTIVTIANQIINYMKNHLSSIDSVDSSAAIEFYETLKVLLVENILLWTDEIIKLALFDLLRATMSAYERGTVRKDIRTKILMLLCDIILNGKLHEYYGREIFSSWISTISNLLCQPFITKHAINAFTCLAKQQNQIFLSGVESKAISIIENVQRIHIVGATDPMEGRLLILNLFYWIKTLKRDDIQVAINQLDSTLKSYIECIITIR